MGKDSKIAWCDHTFNPWVGCTKISAGCDNCYAEVWAKRSGNPSLWQGNRRLTKTWADPLKWNRKAEATGTRPRVFCASLGDWLDTDVPLDWLSDLLSLIRSTPNLDWLLLTKRHKRLMDFAYRHRFLPNVRLGITIEDQHHVNLRLSAMAHAQALGWPTFASYEPALGPVDWTAGTMAAIDWLICGAESGPRRRPFDEDWARAARDACQETGTPFFYKQSYSDGRKVDTPELDGRRWVEFPAPRDKENDDGR